MTFPSYVSLITLGVADIARATAFYERLGFRRSKRFSNDAISFFQLANLVLAVWSRMSLAEDAMVSDTPGTFSGVALAINVQSEKDVDSALNCAAEAGGVILKPAGKTFWGGYAGYFGDPDGHIFEVAHNPFFSLDANGRPHLGDDG